MARQEFEQCPDSLLGAADRRQIMLLVCLHIENNVFDILKTWRDTTRRCASRSVCDPFKGDMTQTNQCQPMANKAYD